MYTYSIVVRLRRRVTEDAHVSVPLSSSLMRDVPEADGSLRMDTDRLFAEAVTLGRDDSVVWREEGAPVVEVHPMQTPPPDANTPSNGAIARRWLDCFARHDLDALLDLYADDAVHTSPKLRARQPETGGFVRGKNALRAWWADAFARLPGLRYELRTMTVDRERVLIEYTRINPGDDDLAVAEVLDVAQGRIVASRVYHG